MHKFPSVETGGKLTQRAEDRIERWHGRLGVDKRRKNRDAAYNFVLAMTERAVQVEDVNRVRRFRLYFFSLQSKKKQTEIRFACSLRSIHLTFFATISLTFPLNFSLCFGSLTFD